MCLATYTTTPIEYMCIHVHVSVCDYFDTIYTGGGYIKVQEGKIVTNTQLDLKLVIVMTTNFQPPSTGSSTLIESVFTVAQVMCRNTLVLYLLFPDYQIELNPPTIYTLPRLITTFNWLIVVIACSPVTW